MSDPNAVLDPDGACSSLPVIDTSVSEDLSLSDTVSVPKPNVLLDPDEVCTPTSSTGILSVSKDLLSSGEKLEDTGKSKCSEVQIPVNEQVFGGARPKTYKRHIGTNQALAKKELECSGDCSGIQIDSREGEIPKKYYAVSFPSEDFIIKGDPLIFEKKEDAIQAIKQNPGARFREFTNLEEARKYASIPFETQVSSSHSRDNPMFKPLKKRKLVKFEKCIRNGDVKKFLQLVWSNPRYLINENDYPTVIKEETESNALHIAITNGQIMIFVEILHVLQDFQFMSILYPKDEMSRIQTRIRCIVDFYLNTTEKEYSETPLCLACRFGHEDIVKILLTFSESLLTEKFNKNIICQNHDCSTSHKMSMLKLFTEMYYVPIVQDEVSKYVDKVCDAQTVLAAVTTHPVKAGTAAIYCAFAGPAPFSTAKEMYHHLKGKKHTFLKAPLNAVLAPSQKHIEKHGRKLSKKYNIGWIEYWRSLGVWLDISSPNGLMFLEKHLSKLDNQINILPNVPTPFMDIIKSFIEGFVSKISEISVTDDKLCFFQELQTLVLFMDCFINYSFSSHVKLFSIHEELGHILFLKLTDDNHRNLENFEALKLLLINQFCNITCYQKSMWKMLCCVLRFASYFQQDSEFVMKPKCHCDFATVEDLYFHSSKSCYFELLSWRQDITNELILKYEFMAENPLLEEAESFNILLSSDAEDDESDFAADISTPEVEDTTFDAGDKVHTYDKYFLESATFIFAYCTVILNYYTSKDFIEIFQSVMKSWKPICKLNYQQDIHLPSIHYEMAFCLFVQFYYIPTETVQWCKTHLIREVSSVSKMFPSHEWTHLICVTSLFLSMLDGNACIPCKCHYYTDSGIKSVEPLKCVMVLRKLRKHLIRFKLQNSDPEMSPEESDIVQSKEEEEEYVTPPESLPGMKSIYVERDAFSDEDINIYRALVEARVDTRKYHQVTKWKSLVKFTLAQLQNKAPTLK